jgi:hypothetical protein
MMRVLTEAGFAWVGYSVTFTRSGVPSRSVLSVSAWRTSPKSQRRERREIEIWLAATQAGGPRLPYMVFRLPRIKYLRVPRVSRFSRPG